MFGTGRLINGALIDPTPEAYLTHGPSAYLDRLWRHIIQNVNNVVPQHSRLLRALIIIVDEEKPLLITDKGTVKSKASIELYAAEIDAAYRALEEGDSSEGGLSTVPLFEPGNAKSLESCLLTLLNDVLGTQLGVDDDFFAGGMDSLLAAQYRSAVSSALKTSGYSIALPKNIIYTHPTISELLKYLTSLVANPLAPSSPFEDSRTLRSMLEDTVNAYTSNFVQHRPDHSLNTSPEGEVYVVTGTTGSLGSFFMSLLLKRPTVRKVYLFNRSSRSMSFALRHQISFEEKGLDFGLLQKALDTGRADLVAIDLLEADLGISNAIRHQACHLNGWAYDYHVANQTRFRFSDALGCHTHRPYSLAAQFQAHTSVLQSPHLRRAPLARPRALFHTYHSSTFHIHFLRCCCRAVGVLQSRSRGDH